MQICPWDKHAAGHCQMHGKLWRGMHVWHSQVVAIDVYVLSTWLSIMANWLYVKQCMSHTQDQVWNLVILENKVGYLILRTYHSSPMLHPNLFLSHTWIQTFCVPKFYIWEFKLRNSQNSDRLRLREQITLFHSFTALCNVMAKSLQ